MRQSGIILIQLQVNDLGGQVKIKAELTYPFKNTQGLKQGDGLVLTLVKVVSGYSIRKLKLYLNSPLQHQYVQTLRYADENGIMARLWQADIDTIKTLGEAH